MKFVKNGKHFVLKPELCYPGTSVEVNIVGYKKWQIKMIVTDLEIRAGEMAREKGSTVSTRTWKTARTAKAHAISINRNKKWLEIAGVTFSSG